MEHGHVGSINLPKYFNKYMVDKFNTDWDCCITVMANVLRHKTNLHEELIDIYELKQKYNKKMKHFQIV